MWLPKCPNFVPSSTFFSFQSTCSIKNLYNLYLGHAKYNTNNLKISHMLNLQRGIFNSSHCPLFSVFLFVLPLAPSLCLAFPFHLQHCIANELFPFTKYYIYIHLYNSFYIVPANSKIWC